MAHNKGKVQKETDGFIAAKRICAPIAGQLRRMGSILKATIELNMTEPNRQRIANHYLQIWDDFQVIQFMDLNVAERAELHKMYCEEVRLVPDNSWCGPCVVEWLKELIFLFKSLV
jgi:hypothetical protein